MGIGAYLDLGFPANRNRGLPVGLAQQNPFQSTICRQNMKKPLFKCMTKATTAEGDDLRRSWNWVTSRRGTLKVMPDALVCGDWRIPYDDIDEAILFSIWTIYPGFLLRVKSGDTIYQFGLNWNRFWKNDLPFPVSREKGKLKHSAFSIISRILLIGCIIYWIWSKTSS